MEQPRESFQTRVQSCDIRIWGRTGRERERCAEPQNRRIAGCAGRSKPTVMCSERRQGDSQTLSKSTVRAALPGKSSVFGRSSNVSRRTEIERGLLRDSTRVAKGARTGAQSYPGSERNTGSIVETRVPRCPPRLSQRLRCVCALAMP